MFVIILGGLQDLNFLINGLNFLVFSFDEILKMENLLPGRFQLSIRVIITYFFLVIFHELFGQI
jgi:hypothetical protein